MSNSMDDVTKKIKDSVSKKKMSLSKDYSPKLAGAPVGQQAIASTPARQQGGMPVSPRASADSPTSKPISDSAPVGQQAGNKKKITFYCGYEEQEMLMNLFIDTLKQNKKIDKSALICQAIRLLYEQRK